MKKFLNLFVFCFCIIGASVNFAYAQGTMPDGGSNTGVPEKMSYQAVIRDANGALLSNQIVGVQITIWMGSTQVYVETHTPTTNTNGLISIEVGAGTVVSGVFSTLDWGNGLFSIQNEIDPDGGTNYSITGTSPLLSVPYAFHAKTVDHAPGDNMQPYLTVNYIIAMQGDFPSTGGTDPGTTLLGEIKLFAGSFAPAGWEFCNGQEIPISQNSALFSIIGTTYGGNGTTTFGLPDLRGRAPIHAGQGTNLTNRVLGESGGTE
ncbi:MAG: tail fiber protein [Moheibacter sp.]